MRLIYNDPPDPFLTETELYEWSGIQPAVISDDINRQGVMKSFIKPIQQNVQFAGLALTVDLLVGTNAAIQQALMRAFPGAVIVADAKDHQDTAVVGGILYAAAQVAGLRAIVLDGSVRDLAEIRAGQLPVFARGVVPKGPHQGKGGSINIPIQCGGVVVNPGDLIVGDDDGVVVVRPDQTYGLLEKCRNRLAKEESTLASLKNGVLPYELEKLENN